MSSREIRRVPINFKHPTDKNGNYVPLLDNYLYTKTLWDEGKSLWSDGLKRNIDDVIVKRDDKYRNFTWEEYDDVIPNPDHFLPVWTDEERDGYCLYETVTEGTPVTPVYSSLLEMAEGRLRYHSMEVNDISIVEYLRPFSVYGNYHLKEPDYSKLSNEDFLKVCPGVSKLRLREIGSPKKPIPAVNVKEVIDEAFKSRIPEVDDTIYVGEANENSYVWERVYKGCFIHGSSRLLSLLHDDPHFIKRERHYRKFIREWENKSRLYRAVDERPNMTFLEICDVVPLTDIANELALDPTGGIFTIPGGTISKAVIDNPRSPNDSFGKCVIVAESEGSDALLVFDGIKEAMAGTGLTRPEAISQLTSLKLRYTKGWFLSLISTYNLKHRQGVH